MSKCNGRESLLTICRVHMRAAYLIHEQHEDKAEDKGHPNVGVQPGMVVAVLVSSWDLCHLLRLHPVLHLARWVMLSCDRQTNTSGHTTQTRHSHFFPPLPKAFLTPSWTTHRSPYLRSFLDNVVSKASFVSPHTSSAWKSKESISML